MHISLSLSVSKLTNGNAVALYLYARDERNEVCFHQSVLIKLKKKKEGKMGGGGEIDEKKIAN